MTDRPVDAERARVDRIARLQRTPAPVSSARRRRRHPAQRSRIVAASLGATTMFGIVTALGVSNAAATPAAVPVAPSQVGQPAGVAAAPADTSTTTVAPVPTDTPAPETVPPTLPAVTVLTPAPVIQVVAPTPQPVATAAPQPAPRPAPVATTSGS